MKIGAVLIVLLLAASLLFQANLYKVNASSPASPLSVSYESASITQYHLPNGSSEPWGIVSEQSTGLLWFVEQSSNQIGSFDPSTSKFSEYNIPTQNSLPEEIAIAPNHNIWITELQGNKLGELIRQNSTIVEFLLPRGPENLGCGPIGVTAAPDGNIWLTCEFSNQIDEFFPSNSTFREFNLPVFYSAPLQIVFDGNDNFWFTAADANMLGYVTVSQLQNGTTNGINEFAPTNQSFVTTINDPQQTGGKLVSSLSTPSQIALSPDGQTLWITEHTASAFDNYNTQTKSLVKYWTSQTHNPNYVESLPNGVALDNNGNVWITEHYGNKIAEFNPTTEQLVEYPIPCCDSSIAGSLYLAIAPNGGVWFTEFYGNSIAELKPVVGNQPVNISFSSSQFNVTSTGNLTIPVSISFNSPQAKNLTADFDISGISNTGKLVNLSATFSPLIAIIDNGTTKTTYIELTAHGLVTGIHYLTVSARDISSNVTYSAILKLNVSNPSAALKGLILEAVIIGIIASVVVIGSMVIFFRYRRPRRSRSRR